MNVGIRVRPRHDCTVAGDVMPRELIAGIITPVGIFRLRQLWSHWRQLGF